VSSPNRAKPQSWLQDWQRRSVWLVSVAVVTLLVCYPLGMLVRASFVDEAGIYTLDNYISLFTRSIFLAAIAMSLKVAVCSTLLSVAIGVPVAWAVSRTNMPLKGWIRNLVLASFITPPYLGALAWIFLLGPQAGKLNMLLRQIFGLEQMPFDVFTIEGLIFVTFIYSYPYVFVNCVTALDNMDGDQEDAARILGATVWKTALKVTIPLMGPAIAGGAIFAFIEAITIFGTAVMIGMPVGLHTIPTRIYVLFQYPPRYELAAALCMPLLLVTAGLLLCQRLYFGVRQFVTVTGKAAQPRLIELGYGKYLLVALCIVVTACSVVLPYLMLAIVSISKSWGNPLSFENMTLSHYGAIFVSGGIARRALINSLFLAVSAATLAALLTAALATMVERTDFRGRGLVGFIAMVPFAVPGIALGVAMMWAYISQPIALYGTIWILLVTYVTKWIPLGFMSARLSLKQMSSEFEEAARNLGATWTYAFVKVTLPLIALGLVIGWLQIFIHAIGELAASSLLYSPGKEVLSVLVLILFDQGRFESVAALAILLLVIVWTVVFLARKLAGGFDFNANPHARTAG
jgi:iron(III) transport system permease protein